MASSSWRYTVQSSCERDTTFASSRQFVSWRTKFVDHVFSPFRITKKRLNRHRNFNGYYAVGGRDKPVRCALRRLGPGSHVRVLDPPLSTAFEPIWQQNVPQLTDGNAQCQWDEASWNRKGTQRPFWRYERNHTWALHSAAHVQFARRPEILGDVQFGH